MRSCAAVLIGASLVSCFRPAVLLGRPAAGRCATRARVLRACDDAPSDSGEDEEVFAEPELTNPPVDVEVGDEVKEFVCYMDGESDSESLTNQLLRLCAATDRGQAAGDDDRTQLTYLISCLEGLEARPDVSGGALDGSWRLVYAGCPAYRSSPFFWAFKKLAEGLDSAVPVSTAEDGSLAAAIFAVTDGIPFKRVGSVKQTLRGTAGGGELVSQVELKISLFDSLLPPQQSIMTTTAGASPDPSDSSCTRLSVQKTEVKQSTVSALLPWLDGLLSVPTAAAFDALKPGSADVTMRTTYLSARLRIARAAEGGPNDVFAFVNEAHC